MVPTVREWVDELNCFARKQIRQWDEIPQFCPFNINMERGGNLLLNYGTMWCVCLYLSISRSISFSWTAIQTHNKESVDMQSHTPDSDAHPNVHVQTRTHNQLRGTEARGCVYNSWLDRDRNYSPVPLSRAFADILQRQGINRVVTGPYITPQSEQKQNEEVLVLCNRIRTHTRSRASRGMSDRYKIAWQQHRQASDCSAV